METSTPSILSKFQFEIIHARRGGQSGALNNSVLSKHTGTRILLTDANLINSMILGTLNVSKGILNREYNPIAIPVIHLGLLPFYLYCFTVGENSERLGGFAE